MLYHVHVGIKNLTKGIYNMPGSKYLWYRWTGGDGKRRATSLKTESLDEAIEKAKRIQDGEFIARWDKGEARATPATKLVDTYLAMAQNRAKKPMRPRTARTIKYILSQFLRDNGIESASDISYQGVEKWLGGLKTEGKSADTLNKYAMTLRPFIRYLSEKRLVEGSQFEKFEIPEIATKGRKNWLPSDVANGVIAESKDPHLTFVLLCGFDAGLRKSEIIAAKVKWFDLSAGILHVQNDPDVGFILKDRENRAIPLTTKFKAFLTTYLEGRNPDEYVLEPGKANGKSAYRFDFKRALYSHFKNCGVTCTIHDMRRSFASIRVSQGRSIYKVAKWLGDGVAVVERSYGHLSPADKDIDVD
jgi:integrase